MGGLVAATAVVLPLVALAISLSRAAGRGFRLVMGLQAGRGTAAGLALWVGLMAPILVVLGSILKDKTNHRGLGGGTFGVLALVVIIGAAALAHRVVETGRWLVDRGVSPRAVATMIALLSVGPMIVVSFPLLQSHPTSPDSHAVAAALIDGLIFTLAASVAVTFDVGDRLRGLARRFGHVAAAALMVLGISWLSLSPSLGGAMRSGGGLSAALLRGLERWTDRDGDGVGSHFGGRDCDEGDPRRYPGANDPAGDGIDQNCDGVDGEAEGPSGRSSAAADVAAPATAVLADPAVPATPAPAGNRPSIVLVMLDTVRADHTSVYGYAKQTTPQLAALAARGTVFELAYSPASDTQRAVMPIFSGKSFADTPKDRREWPTLKAEVDTVAERMKKVGYRTAGVSSFQWLSKERGFDQGFDQFVEIFKDESPERTVTGPRTVRAARAEIEKADGVRPLFLWVHLFDAHEEYRRHEGFDFGRGTVGAYDSEIGFVDKQLGDLMDAVDASKLKDNVAWVVFGSQGEGFDEHDSSGHGKELYEEVVRVPLVVALPAVKEGRRVPKMAVSTADIPLTLLELAGASSEGAQGTSLLPLTRGGEAPRPPLVLAGSNRSAVIDHPLKLIVIERKKKERLLLFDLAVDPKETKDLSESRPEDLARLRALAPTRRPAAD